MEDDLPSNYDVIVIGTGMPECILAAAVARIGKTVLHLDKNDYYGGDWASFNFDQFQNWIKYHQQTETEQVLTVNPENIENLIENETCIYLNKPISNISNVWEINCISENEDKVIVQDKNDEPINSNIATSANEEQDSSTSFNTTGEEQNSAEPISEISAVSESTERHEQSDHNDGEQSHNEEAASNAPVENVEIEIKATNSEKESSNEQSSSLVKNKSRKQWTYSCLLNQYRKFNLDLAPKLLFSRGALVELLISSNIARYAEFKSVTRILTLLDKKLKQVPCSRSDVFSTKDVSVVEKRMLMKFLTFCFEYHKQPEEYRGYEGRPFVEFLKSRKLTPPVEHYILHAIAMVDETALTLQGLKATQTFLESLGRYGNSPFLWSLYGSAELPQCFCRLCAVFGGIYHLKRKAEALILNSEGDCNSIMSNGQRMNCSWLIMESSYARSVINVNNSSMNSLLPENSNPKRISRGIFITDSSILPAEREQITLLRIPTLNGIMSTVTVLELGPGAMVCPDQTYVVHFTCQSVAETAKEDLLPAMEILFKPINNELIEKKKIDDVSKPKILWCVFFNQLDTTTVDLNIEYPKNLLLTSTPGTDLDCEYAVQEAKQLFQKMFPGEEFLPRAPDPEEISLEPDINNPGENEPTENSENNQENYNSESVDKGEEKINENCKIEENHDI